MMSPRSLASTCRLAVLLAAIAVAAASPAPAAAVQHARAVAAPVAASAPQSNSRCITDQDADPKAAPTFKTVSPDAAGNSSAGNAPRMTLLAMVRTAVRRSNAVGAAKLLSEAAAIDIDGAHAAYYPQVNITGQVGGTVAGAVDAASEKGGSYQAGANVTAPIYDGGRTRDMIDYRSHLAEAARFGEISTREQVALQTVSLALDRSRYAVEAQVYDEYAHKMGCMVEALEQIVAMDHGRTSELVQVRKSLEQAQFARDQLLSQKRILEIRLKRFVGDELPPSDGVSAVMLDTPSLPDLLALASRAPEIQSLDSQAAAQDAYVQSLLDGQKPQLGVLLSASKSLGVSNSRSTAGALTLSWQLFNAANGYASEAARKRAAAAKLSRDDALEARKYRMSEVYEQATRSMERARSAIDILHNSALLSNFTLQQWQQLGRRSLFDVMAAEGDHYNMRVQYVDALYDTQQANALLWSLGLGLAGHLE